MNLLNVLKVMAVIVVLMVVSSIQAQEPTKDVNPEFISFVKVEGKTCVATDAEEYGVLMSLVNLVNTCKQARANGTIDSTSFREKTASYFKDARDAGVRVSNGIIKSN